MSLPVCKDAISRKWVLNEIITKVEDDDSLTDEKKGPLSAAKYIIRHAPTVTPTERTGEWVKVSGYVTPGGDPVWECSECGKGRHVYGIEASSYQRDVSDQQWIACPNCGARMVGESE